MRGHGRQGQKLRESESVIGSVDKPPDNDSWSSGKTNQVGLGKFYFASVEFE